MGILTQILAPVAQLVTKVKLSAAHLDLPILFHPIKSFQVV